MRRTRRAALAAAMVLFVVAAPELVSLTTAAPSQRAPGQMAEGASAQTPWAPIVGEKASLRGGTAHVRLLGVNDLHGHLQPSYVVKGEEVGGVAHLAAYMDRLGRGRGRTIRVHAGDMIGASPLVSAHFRDEPTVLAMNEMGFDVGTLGNHEFDEGKKEMLRLVEGGREVSNPGFAGAAFPYVAANTIDRATGRPVLPPYTVVERDGVEVGFIGVTTLETPGIIHPGAAGDFRFADISETVNSHAATLEARGVKAIVVLAHSGALDTDLGGTADEIVTETKQMDQSVDAVFSGHTHNRLDLRIAGTPVVQAEEYGTHLSVIDLAVDRASGEVTEARGNVVAVRGGRIPPDPGVAGLVGRYARRVAPISGRVVGTAGEEIGPVATGAGESALGDFVADGQRNLAGADFALVPTSGLRTGISPGSVTYGELFAVQPSGRDLVRMELSGAEVRRALELQYRSDRDRRLAVSGLRFAHDPTRPQGDRVVALTLPDGKKVDPGTDYTVAVNGFLAAGGGDFDVFERGRNRRTVGTDTGALAKHAERSPQPFPAPDPRSSPRVTVVR